MPYCDYYDENVEDVYSWFAVSIITVLKKKSHVARYIKCITRLNKLIDALENPSCIKTMRYVFANAISRSDGAQIWGFTSDCLGYDLVLFAIVSKNSILWEYSYNGPKNDRISKTVLWTLESIIDRMIIEMPPEAFQKGFCKDSI